MQIVVAPIHPDESGPPVANLQDALLILLERRIIQPLVVPNRPTVEELQKLTEALKQERQQSHFSKATEQVIFYFQIQQGLGDRLRDVGVDEQTATVLNKWLERLRLLTLPEPGNFFIRGTVTTSSGQPVSGAAVRAFDRDMRKKPPIGDAETNEQGQFVIRYGASQFVLGDEPWASGPSLIVRAFLGDQQIGQDVTRPKSKPDEVINFTLPAPSVSEWERLSAAIIPLLKGQGEEDRNLPPWEINDDDLTFIVEETGLEREQIRLWALAFTAGRDAAGIIQPGALISTVADRVNNLVLRSALPNDLLAFAIFYGWFRLGLPATLSDLWATPTGTLLATLRRAIEQGIVPSSIGADLNDLSRRIEHVKLDHVLQSPAPGTSALLGDLLATVPVALNVDQTRAIAATATELRAGDPNLVNKITHVAGLERDAAIGVARALRLGELTGGHVPLAEALHLRLRDTEDSEGTLRPLVALRPDEWLDLAYTHGVPEGTTITPVDYANTLAASVERQHPTDALAAHFNDGRRLAQHPVLSNVGTFLRDNTDFDIAKANLNAVSDQAKLDGVAEPQQAQLIDGLRSLQRMNLLGATWDETATLFEKDLYTPDQLIAAGPTQLKSLLEGPIAPERINALYRQAEALHQVTFAAFTAAFSPLSAPRILPINQGGDPPNPEDLDGVILPDLPPTGDIPHTGDPGGNIKLKDFADAVAHHLANRDIALDPGWGRVVPSAPAGIVIPDKTPHLDLTPFIDHQPTLQALFGAQDACACGHCNSVLSPAAYFVDLLQFMTHGDISGRLVDELLLRRPDLQDIELSCNNTNNEVPAIDLALEILENAVALPLRVDLPAGTKINDQLKNGIQVGLAVRAALEKTVQTLPDVVIATLDTNNNGTWTVVDGRRRWKISAQPEDALKVRFGTDPARSVDTSGLNLPALIAAMDRQEVPKGAESTFAQLFVANHKNPDFTDYHVTIEPLQQVAGRSWRVRYQFVAQLLIEANQLTLQTAKGVVWQRREYEEPTLIEVKRDLAKNSVPPLVQKLISAKFSDVHNLSVKATELGRPASWTITSVESVLTLSFSPAQLNITSLTYQSGDPKADAVAWPENHNPAAYAKLTGDDVVFPWSLPVDLPLEEVRLFLERVRSSRRRLIELTQPMDQSLGDNVVFASEVLELSKSEAVLIATVKTEPAVFVCWGLTSGQIRIWDAASASFVTGSTSLSLLKNVSILLQQSCLSFEELQAVFATQFVQGGDGPLTITPPNTCRPSEMTVGALTPGHLDRVHRFVRLQRRLGWSEQELDTAIKITTGADLNNATLIGLAQLQQLCELLDLTVASILGWYGPDASDDQKKRLLGRSLGLTIDELQHALALFAISNPFSNPGETLAFCQRVKNFQSANLTFEDLRYLLQDEYTLGSNTGLDHNQLQALADAVYNSVGSILDRREKTLARQPAGSESVDTRNDREQEALRLARENDALRLGTRVARADAVIAVLAASLSAARELVDDLLRIRLRHPANTSRPAIDVFLSPLGDFIDVASLIRKLSTDSDPASISSYLWSQFPAADQLVLEDPASTPSQQQTILVSVLNRVLNAASIYQPARFIHVTLSAETDALNSAMPAATGADLIRLNRLLMEDAFPLEIAKHRSSDMLFVAGEVAERDSALVQSVLVRLYKSALLCDALKLSRTDLPLLRTQATDTTGLTALDFNALPATRTDPVTDLEDFERLLALVQIRGVVRGAGDMLHQYAALNFAGSSADPWSDVDSAHQVLMTGFGLTRHVVEAAAKQLHISTRDQYRNPIVLKRLIELLAALKQLGATMEAVSPATAPSPADANGFVSASPNDRDANAARELLRAKYGESQWRDLIKPIADKLRERQRDALVDYLIARDQRPRDGDANSQISSSTRMRDADDLYEHYLIDVQTSSCLKTTRLLQATAAVQLFVQRLLLNLEHGLSLTADKRALWEWMHNYRVWEANRKVFLFPENWLLPELRDDKTPTFSQMEGALTERETSPESTRNALLSYLEELADIAQISVIAMHEDRRLEGDPPNQTLQTTLYVVGRTPNEPYRYFWRSCARFGDKGMSWSGWEPLTLDNANDFIMPFVYEGDLHVAWPIFRETRNNDRLMWEVQIAWTKRSDRGWVKRKIGKAQLLNVERLPNKDSLASFAFRFNKTVHPVPGSATLKKERIAIDSYAATEIDVAAHTSLQPDPSLLQDTTPTGYLSVSAGQWNVNCQVKGVVYKYVINDKEGDKFYKGWPGVRVDLRSQRHDQENTTADVIPLTPSRTTGANGEFSFSFTTNVYGRNGGSGIINGALVELTFNLPGHVPIVKTGNLVKSSAQGSEYYFYWNWEINVGLEDKTLADRFRADRDVRYQSVGAFVFETGKDVRLDRPPSPIAPPAPWPLMHFSDIFSFSLDLPMGIDGNRFSRTTDRFYYQSTSPLIFQSLTLDYDGSFVPSPTSNFPVFVTRATQSPAPEGLTQPLPREWNIQTWYVQDNNRGFYLQKHADGWHVWSDGHPFASSYRTAATISKDLLFSTEVESDLVDSSQDNFSRPAPYANYNWELFLHVPLMIADHLATQQRFADARLWLHAVFDPTTEKKDPKTHQIPQFWRFLPFDNATQPISIAKLLTWLADPTMVDPADTPQLEENLRAQIDDWKKNPFMPHAIARLRPSAYQWFSFFAYLEVLIGWGDQLFRRDTRESVNDATLLYVLAAKLLGPRPRTIATSTPTYSLTYRLLQCDPNKIDSFSNAWLNYSDLPGIKQLANAQNGSTRSSQSFAMLKQSNQQSDQKRLQIPDKSSAIQHLTSLSSLAFCIPQNEKVTEFHDRLDQRLFNVRNCRNIDGIFRELPLYEPPIDPLLLIRARAAGLDLGDVIANVYAPLPNYRFSFTLQKALELCGEVKSLGSALLSAMEKKDAEELTLLRSGQETAMLKLVRDTRKQQVAEAEANLNALHQSEATLLERFGQYQKLLGKPTLTKGQDGLPVVEQSSSLSVATDSGGDGSGLGLSRREVDQFSWTATANSFTQVANSGHLLAGILNIIPNTWAGDALVAGSTFGGSNLGSAASAIAKAIEMIAVDASYHASQAGALGAFERRQDEWVHQSKLAIAELKQIQKQIVAAEIRKDIAERELNNHDTQIENAQEVEDFMRSKFTSQQLFRWMSSQLAGIYFRTYQLALDQAYRSERAYEHELGLDRENTPFIQSGQWDSLKRGLLAGEHLHHDLKRMESAYLERNVREFEITKHISLLQLDPRALINLKETGACDFSVPEVFFDLDYPGHYMRRLKMVSLSIPCVVGPYASVSATLRLTKNAIRFNPKVDANAGSYKRQRTASEEDPRFRETAATITAIVTSTAQQDSGMFEINLRDERFLPFEGAGAISNWRLELPEKFEAFNYDTISDVVLHLRYTARDAGDSLKTPVVAQLSTAIDEISSATATGNPGLARLFSFRHEFPTEWYRFLNPSETKNGQTLEFELTQDRFPYLFRGRKIQIQRMDIFLKFSDEALVDYQSSAALVLDITPPGPTPIPNDPAAPPIPTLVSDEGMLNGLPHAYKDFSKDFDQVRDPGKWSLTIAEADINNIAGSLRTTSATGNHSRLKAAAIQDLLVVCRYSI